MKTYILVLLSVVWFYGCTSKEKAAVPIAQPASKFIYKTDRQFTFLATHFDKAGNLTAVDTLFLSTNGKVINEQYGQTYSSWKSTGDDFGTGFTGITEHDTAVWLHPPRSGKYRKLELSPFPMVKFPLQTGTKWTWRLLVGNHYSIACLAEWADNTNEEFKSSYSILRKLPVQTPMGIVDCFEIEGLTTSKFARTQLKAYFNTTYGFVKLDYKNIDQSKLLLELIEMKYAQTGRELPFKDLILQ